MCINQQLVDGNVPSAFSSFAPIRFSEMTFARFGAFLADRSPIGTDWAHGRSTSGPAGDQESDSVRKIGGERVKLVISKEAGLANRLSGDDPAALDPFRRPKGN